MYFDMALNYFMHDRNRYKHNRPDFEKLAQQYPEFDKFVSVNESGKTVLDFQDPEALRALTCTLLKEDFGLVVELPLDHIIPTVPLRLNYIHWLEDLIQDVNKDGEDIWGIDVGCGTSCIYPLLGSKMNGWHFKALEVDLLALQYAKENVARNNLNDRINVIENTTTTLFYDLLLSSSSPARFHFTMCNPPFFSNFIEAQGLMTSRSQYRSEPKSVSTADEVEMIVEGGEVEFVKRMIKESLQVKDRVVWFTSLVGKKSSLVPLKAELRAQRITNWTVTEFCQGRTMRWGIAWTFDASIKPHLSPNRRKRKAKPPLSIEVPPEYVQRLLQGCTGSGSGQGRGRQEKLAAVTMAIEKLLKDLEMVVQKKMQNKWAPKLDVKAYKNTWSHQRNKRREKKRKETGGPCDGEEDAIKSLCGRVRVVERGGKSDASATGGFSSVLEERKRKETVGPCDGDEDANKSLWGRVRVAERGGKSDASATGGFPSVLEEAVPTSVALPVAVISDERFDERESGERQDVAAADVGGNDALLKKAEIFKDESHLKDTEWLKKAVHSSVMLPASIIGTDDITTKLKDRFEVSEKEQVFVSKKQKVMTSNGTSRSEKPSDGGPDDKISDEFRSSLSDAMCMSLQIPASVIGDGKIQSQNSMHDTDKEEEREYKSNKRKHSGDLLSCVKDAFQVSYSLPAAIVGQSGDINGNTNHQLSDKNGSHPVSRIRDNRYEKTPSFSVLSDTVCSKDEVSLEGQSSFKHETDNITKDIEKKSKTPHVHKHSPLCNITLQDSDVLLSFVVGVKLGVKGVISLEISCEEGQSRELLHQVGQHIKNHMQIKMK